MMGDLCVLMWMFNLSHFPIHKKTGILWTASNRRETAFRLLTVCNQTAFKYLLTNSSLQYDNFLLDVIMPARYLIREREGATDESPRMSKNEGVR